MDLDFRVNIPGFVLFRVGSAGSAAGDDRVAFDVTDRIIAGGFPGDGIAVPANAALGAGDGTDGNLSIQVRTNLGGALTINKAASGGNIGLVVPYDDITATDGGTGCAGGSGNIPVPLMQNAASASVVPVAGPTTNLADTWCFSYDNTTAYAPGDYGAAGATNTSNGVTVYSITVP